MTPSPDCPSGAPSEGETPTWMKSVLALLGGGLCWSIGLAQSHSKLDEDNHALRLELARLNSVEEEKDEALALVGRYSRQLKAVSANKSMSAHLKSHVCFDPEQLTRHQMQEDVLVSAAFLRGRGFSVDLPDGFIDAEGDENLLVVPLAQLRLAEQLHESGLKFAVHLALKYGEAKDEKAALHMVITEMQKFFSECVSAEVRLSEAEIKAIWNGVYINEFASTGVLFGDFVNEFVHEQVQKMLNGVLDMVNRYCASSDTEEE